MWSRRVELLVPRAVGRAQSFSRHRADHVRGRREDLGVVKREATDRAHDLRPVDQRDALLRPKLDGLQSRRLERICSAPACALVDRLALADEDERGVRERREIARRAHAAVPRDRRMNPPIDHVAQQIDDLCPHTRASGREGVGSEDQDRADHILG